MAVTGLPNRVANQQTGGRGLSALEEQQLQQLQAQLNPDDVQSFINGGGFARALQSNPAAQAMLAKMLQQVAQNASRDPGQAAPGANKTLSADDVAQGNQEIATAGASIDQQRAAISQQKTALGGEIQQLEAKQNRTPVEEALLSGKKSKMNVLNALDQNLDLKKQGLDAAKFALSDGVLTASEKQDLQTIARSTSMKDRVLGQLGAQADDAIGRAQGFADAGQTGAAPATGTANALSTGTLGNLGNLNTAGAAGNSVLNDLGLGNLANQPAAAAANATGNAQFNPLAQNSLNSPSRIGDANALGSGIDQELASLGSLGGGGGFFEDKVFAIMCKIVEDFQKQIEQRLEKLQQQAQAAEAQQGQGGQQGGQNGQESRNIEFEKIKYDMQKLSQMQQAMSNVLNSMDELAKSAIHHIKAG